MRYKIIPILLAGATAAHADILNSTQRFFGEDDNFAEYAEDSGQVDGFEIDEVPYSPADSDLGVQEVLVDRDEVDRLIFRFSTSILRTDNAANESNPLAFTPTGDEPSWLVATRLSASWRPHLFDGWFADIGAGVDSLQFEDGGAVDYENYNGRVGIYKNFPDLDDLIFFTRYEYQRIATGSLLQSDYNAQRIRAGLQKTLYAAPRHRITGGLSGALEWSANPDMLQRDEVEMNVSYRYSITDDLYTLASATVSKFEYQDFGREDWSYGFGLELIWEMTKNVQLSASVFYDKNDSNTDTFGGFTPTNDYQSWTGGLGVGCQWAF
ncbi:MAG: outer membrane beta-barrel protein [Luteolibacter sp.]